MIVRNHLPLKQIWPTVSRRLLLLFFFDLTIAALYTWGGISFLAVPSLPLTMMGSAIGIFLAFRTNSAYERWWEARILWGGLVNEARNFCRQILTMIETNPDGTPTEFQRRLLNLEIAFVHAFRCHLRKQNPYPELRTILESDEIARLQRYTNVPTALLLRCAEDLRESKQRNEISDYRWVRMDSTLSELCNIFGACERIKNTPLPRQYDFFPRILVTMYCLMLPFGLVEGMGMLTPIGSTVISFIFVALDTVGREIEAPFENTVHDTPMTSLSRSIEINLRQLFGENPVAAEVKPLDGFVY